MKPVALITYKKSPDLSKSDLLLVKPLRKLGFEAKAVPWDDSKINWNNYGLVILRSCWNYQL